MTQADGCWLVRRSAAFCTCIARTFAGVGSEMPGVLIGYFHVGHMAMRDEIPFAVNIHDMCLVLLSNAHMRTHKHARAHVCTLHNVT